MNCRHPPELDEIECVRSSELLISSSFLWISLPFGFCVIIGVRKMPLQTGKPSVRGAPRAVAVASHVAEREKLESILFAEPDDNDDEKKETHEMVDGAGQQQEGG